MAITFEMAMERLLEANPTTAEVLELADRIYSRNRTPYQEAEVLHLPQIPQHGSPYGSRARCRLCGVTVVSDSRNPLPPGSGMFSRPEYQAHIKFHNDIERRLKELERKPE